MKKPRKKAKRKQWAQLVYICPHCFAADVLEQPVPMIQYGMSRLPKRKRAVKPKEGE